MNKLDKIRRYSDKLRRVASWTESNDAIVNITNIKNKKKKKEYIYEFYCCLRILTDLSKHYHIEIKNNKIKNCFPKAPGSKTNFPFFKLTDKANPKSSFQICLGVDIIGVAKETSAPDISFQVGESPMRPKHNHVIMIHDAKFKHSLNSAVSESDFNKVHAMVLNLKCDNASSNPNKILFDKLNAFIGNCLISNGRPYKKNAKHHKLFNIKEITNFDTGKPYQVVG